MRSHLLRLIEYRSQESSTPLIDLPPSAYTKLPACASACVYLLCKSDDFSVHVSSSELNMKTEPDTFVKLELSPPVIKMQPSLRPIATE